MTKAAYHGDLEFISYVLDEKVPEESPARKVANTVTAGIGSLVSIAAVALSLPIELPDWAYLIIVAVTTIGTTLGVNVTKNGFSASQQEKLRRWQAEYIDQNHEINEGMEQEAGTIDHSPEPSPQTSSGNRVVDVINDVSDTATDLRAMVERTRERWYGN